MARFGYLKLKPASRVPDGILLMTLVRGRLPVGVIAIDLAEAIADAKYGELVREHLARSADYNETPSQLEHCFCLYGAFCFDSQRD